jgi:preprotein translocase subunit SecG
MRRRKIVPKSKPGGTWLGSYGRASRDLLSSAANSAAASRCASCRAALFFVLSVFLVFFWQIYCCG